MSLGNMEKKNEEKDGDFFPSDSGWLLCGGRLLVAWPAPWEFLILLDFMILIGFSLWSVLAAIRLVLGVISLVEG